MRMTPINRTVVTVLVGMAISAILWGLSLYTAMPDSLGICGMLFFSFVWGVSHPGKNMRFVFLLLFAPFCGWVFDRSEFYLFALTVGAWLCIIGYLAGCLVGWLCRWLRNTLLKKWIPSAPKPIQTEEETANVKRRPLFLRSMVFIGWIAGWMLFFYVTSLKPSPKNAIPSDMTGEYLLSPDDVQGYGMIGHPFLDIDMIEAGGTVTVTQESGNTITFSSRINNGRQASETLKISKQSHLVWDEGRLVFYERKMIFGGIFPGVAFQIHQSILTKDAHGDLQITRDQEEKGLLLFLTPFSEGFHSSVLLRQQKQKK